jgi:hypothetical protein
LILLHQQLLFDSSCCIRSIDSVDLATLATLVGATIFHHYFLIASFSPVLDITQNSVENFFHIKKIY